MPYSQPTALHSTATGQGASAVPVGVIEAKKGWRVIDWREIKEYRDLFYFLVLRDVTVVYKQTVLGFTWAILTPLFSMVVFTVVFNKLANVATDGSPAPLFYYSALLPWTYFSSALGASTNSLIQGSQMLTKVYFPRLFIPLVPVFSKLVDFSIASVVLAGMMVWYGCAPSSAIASVPLLLLLMVLTVAGIGLWLSALAIQFRDVRHAIQFLMQILLYASPVVWTASKIPERYHLIYGLYPMAGVIEGFRSAVLGHSPMPWDLILMGALSSLVLFVTGALYFRRMERIFADVA
jgi:lipopolysaccharide transport system permease protein